MQRFLKSTLVAAAVLPFTTFATASPAETTLNVAFQYDLQASAEENYRAANTKAATACEVRGVSLLTAKRLAEPCITDLLDQFVARVGNQDIADLHRQKTGHDISVGRAFAGQ